MKSRWNEEEAPQGDDLDMLVYVSRLLGADTSLVLAGGGNSSVKTTDVDLFGEPLDVLHVKGSGWDMATIEREGFAPLRHDPVERLAELPELADGLMAAELRSASLDARAPAPSVESILHAILPYRFVLHTHADALLALTNTPDGPALVEEVYGNDVVVVPYVMPGFALARRCAELFPAERHEGTIGMVLLNHGLFTFAYDARTAYENHIDLVARALARVDTGAAAVGSRPAPDTDDAPSVRADAAAPSALPPHASIRDDLVTAPPDEQPAVPSDPAEPPAGTPVVAAATIDATEDSDRVGPQRADEVEPSGMKGPAATSDEITPEQPASPTVTADVGAPAVPDGVPRADAAAVDVPRAEAAPVDVPGSDPAPAEQPGHGEAASWSTEPIGEDLDIGAFGAGDPTAFGTGSGALGATTAENDTRGAPTVAGGTVGTSGAVTALAGGRLDERAAVSARTEASPAVRAAAVTLLGELGAVAMLRRDLSAAAGRPLVVRSDTGEDARRFVARDDLAQVAQVGPATPDHVLRTKRVPLVGRDVDGYVRAYEAYVARHRARLGDRPLVPVDPAPRVVVDPELGLLTAGARASDAAIAAEIYRHTMWVIERAVELGGYAAVTEADLFDVEYWELEQAKLDRQPAPSPLTGHVALVTGAASGIGRATAAALLAEGAAVVGLDLDGAVEEVADGPGYVGVQGDATDISAVASAIEASVRAFGGLDVLVLNAGLFPPPEPVAQVSPGSWGRALAIHADAALVALQAAHPFLRVSPVGGSVVVVASKNVPAPGTGAAAYSASKAALTQLARVTALEWGADGIRVNVVHPDAVFDTGLWSDGLVADRAAAYGLTPAQYRTRNVLGAEVRADHVADAIVALCGPTFARTTGAQIAVDGGNDRVI